LQGGKPILLKSSPPSVDGAAAGEQDRGDQAPVPALIEQQ
jgi:hypothetical protein